MKKLSNRDWDDIFDILGFFPGFRSRNKFIATIAILYYIFAIGLVFSGFFYLGIVVTVLPGVFSFGIEALKDKSRSSTIVTIVLVIVLIFSTVQSRVYKLNDVLANINSPTDTIDMIKEALGLDPTYQLGYVSNVVDGDTIDVDILGETIRVRLILVDTPETVHPNKPVEFYGQEASDYTSDLLLGRFVYLEKDVSDTDRYGRALRYVWLKKPATPIPTTNELKKYNVSGRLIAEGYGSLAVFPPDTKYKDQFEKMEEKAKKENLGMWKEDTSTKLKFDLSNICYIGDII